MNRNSLHAHLFALALLGATTFTTYGCKPVPDDAPTMAVEAYPEDEGWFDLVPEGLHAEIFAEGTPILDEVLPTLVNVPVDASERRVRRAVRRSLRDRANVWLDIKQFGDGAVALFRGRTIVAMVVIKTDPTDPDKVDEWFFAASAELDWWTLLTTAVPVQVQNFPTGTANQMARNASYCLGVQAGSTVTCSNRPTSVNFRSHCGDTNVGAEEEWRLTYRPTSDASSPQAWGATMGSTTDGGAFHAVNSNGTRVAATAFRILQSSESADFQFVGAHAAGLAPGLHFPFPVAQTCIREYPPATELWKESANEIKDILQPEFLGVDRYHYSDVGESHERALTCAYSGTKWTCS